MDYLFRSLNQDQVTHGAIRQMLTRITMIYMQCFEFYVRKTAVRYYGKQRIYPK